MNDRPDAGDSADRTPFYLNPATGQSYVTLLPRDPDWAYVFWEITAEGVARSKRNLANGGHGSTLVLRLYSFDGEGEAQKTRADFVEHELKEWISGRVVFLGRPSAQHQAVIGFLGEDGAFSPLCRSIPLRSNGELRTAPTTPHYLRLVPPGRPGEPVETAAADLDEFKETAARSTFRAPTGSESGPPQNARPEPEGGTR